MVSVTRRQQGIIYDLIAQGEIEGLVGGYNGIYFNGTSLIDQESNVSYSPRYGVGDVSGTSISNYGKLFDDVSLSNGDRYISIPAAGDSSTLTSNLERGSETISVGSNFLQRKFTLNPQGSDFVNEEDYINYFIRIPLGNGATYVGVITAVYDPGVTVRGRWKLGVTGQIAVNVAKEFDITVNLSFIYWKISKLSSKSIQTEQN